jgi:mannan endo-1,4-beta-mannosidase
VRPAALIAAAAVLVAVTSTVASAVAGCGPQPGFGSSGPAVSMPVLDPARSLLYLGVYEHGDQGSYAGVTRFSRATGVRPNVVLQYAAWNSGFDFRLAYDARAHQAEPLIQLQPNGISLAAIAAGRYDVYLRTFANEVRRFGGPVIIGFAHEMNGTWYSWSRAHAPAARWVAAWRHVVRVFRGQHAANVTWLWTISHTADVATLRSYWPGPAYVSWVGIDGYFKVPSATYWTIFGRCVAAVRQVTRKPILISETAAGPDTGHVTRDISALFAGVKRQHLLGVVWFDRSQHGGVNEQDWRLEGDRAALSAFNTAVRNYLW